MLTVGLQVFSLGSMRFFRVPRSLSLTLAGVMSPEVPVK
jgi:hypothetical protein